MELRDHKGVAETSSMRHTSSLLLSTQPGYGSRCSAQSDSYLMACLDQGLDALARHSNASSTGRLDDACLSEHHLHMNNALFTSHSILSQMPRPTASEKHRQLGMGALSTEGAFLGHADCGAWWGVYFDTSNQALFIHNLIGFASQI